MGCGFEWRGFLNAFYGLEKAELFPRDRREPKFNSHFVNENLMGSQGNVYAILSGVGLPIYNRAKPKS